MGRWEPDAARRLQQAAFELYAERGYEQTTVAEVAARAGLTERTFFRHFAYKREVLFEGSDEFRCRPPRAGRRRPRVGNPAGGGHGRTRGGRVRLPRGTRPPPPRADQRQPGVAGTRAAKLASLAAQLTRAALDVDELTRQVVTQQDLRSTHLSGAIYLLQTALDELQHCGLHARGGLRPSYPGRVPGDRAQHASLSPVTAGGVD